MSTFSMIDVNTVSLVGRLTRDPELRYTSSGTAVTTLPLAVSRKYTSRTGEKGEETCFINVVVWAKAAEFCAEYLGKGRAVFVETKELAIARARRGDKTLGIGYPLAIAFLARLGVVTS